MLLPVQAAISSSGIRFLASIHLEERYDQCSDNPGKSENDKSQFERMQGQDLASPLVGAMTTPPTMTIASNSQGVSRLTKLRYITSSSRAKLMKP